MGRFKPARLRSDEKRKRSRKGTCERGAGRGYPMEFSFQVEDLGLLISLALMGLGVRLLGLARRGRSTPELLIGLYLLLSPPATSLVMRIPRFDPAWHSALHFAAFCAYALSALALAGFAWRVFRPDAVWAKAFVALIGVWFLGACGLLALGAASPRETTGSLVSRIPLFATYLWLFSECALRHRMLVRRLRIGLADPVVANRFLLFAVWSGVLALLPGVMLMAATLASPEAGDARSPFFAVLVRTTGFAIYGAMWLSFLPPRAYTRWLRRRHAERHPDAVTAAAAGG